MLGDDDLVLGGGGLSGSDVVVVDFSSIFSASWLLGRYRTRGHRMGGAS
jgi:hypothetical protein